MVSVKNPNVTSQNRVRARAARSRKQGLKAVRDSKLPTRVEKADTRRGARPGILPTSGPNAALSKKKQRKVEKQIAHALKRKQAEAEKQKEVDMKDVEEKTSKKQLKTERNAAVEAMEKMELS
ncbi:hypothetical protein VP1G_09935 [Cytospora mali]|uniref:Uncharacterized protein n=1 Tax=Cytospora mali TaxID=578113 RepID=A0A194VFM3_CYTMA|nr:hypothetical protein VP1G_09935 [Valsa mali var. pyri (nom. inval.)]